MTVDPAAVESAGYPPISPGDGEVVLSSKAHDLLRSHVEEAYPEEGCGFLVGPAPNGTANPREIDEAIPVANERQEHRTHRFLIPYQEVVRVEQLAAPSGRAILGFYHSHPDHIAAPSAYDRDHAWPWYVYAVASVEKGKLSDLNVYELDPEGRNFHLLTLADEAETETAIEEEKKP